MTKSEQQRQRQEWQERLAAYRASGQSARAWCAANGVRPHQLRYRLGQEKAGEAGDPASTVWLKATVRRFSVDTGLLVRVGQVDIEVKHGFDPELLSAVVRTLTAIC